MGARIEHYYNSLEEPYKGCLMFIQGFILGYSNLIEEQRKNNTPFYYYEKKWLCFTSYHPKTKEIFISFVNGHRMKHRSLVSEGRKKMKIFKIDPNKDIDVKSLKEVFEEAISIYKPLN